MRVLEATDFYYPWIAGPAPFIRSLSAGLIERGHEVVVACPSPASQPGPESGPPDLYRVRTLPVPFGFHLRAGFPLADLYRLVRRWRPDVVHVHHPFGISLSALAAARGHGVPVVATNHTIPECTLYGLRTSLLYRPARAAFARHIRTVLRLAQAVTTPTQTAAAMLRNLGFPGEVRAISNGVDTLRFRPPNDPPPLEERVSTSSSVAVQPANDSPVVLYTGRLDEDKDMDTFIRAIPHVLARTPARFRIGGEGTDRARLERLVASMNLSDSVQFTGYVDYDELPAIYRRADIYAISSRFELQSISTLEAVASGLPVIAVNAGALPEIVQNGINGFLAPPGDSEAFGQHLVNLLRDATMRRLMGARSRQIAEEHSIGKMVSQYEQVLQSVISRAPRVAGGSAGS